MISAPIPPHAGESEYMISQRKAQRRAEWFTAACQCLSTRLVITLEAAAAQLLREIDRLDVDK